MTDPARAAAEKCAERITTRAVDGNRRADVWNQVADELSKQK